MNRVTPGIAALRPLLRVLAVLLLPLLLVGCQESAPQAQEPVWGKQPCGHCAMLLSERTHGAQLLTVQEDRVFFDDIGCLIAWDAAHPGQAKLRWARQHDQDPKGTGWLAAETATYARAKHTPMDFGFVALAKPATADPAQPSVAWPEVVGAVTKKLQGP